MFSEVSSEVSTFSVSSEVSALSTFSVFSEVSALSVSSVSSVSWEFTRLSILFFPISRLSRAPITVSSSSTGLDSLGSRCGAGRWRRGRSCLSSGGAAARSWSAIAAFKLKPIRLPFGSRLMTLTSISSPTETTSSGLSILRSAISEM